ncbi:MAG: universal stress protein [Terrimicrobiaceae bacterium]
MVEQAGKEECRAVCNDVFRHVLHPTDFSKTSERAYQYLEHVVKETHCAVTLLHVT